MSVPRTSIPDPWHLRLFLIFGETRLYVPRSFHLDLNLNLWPRSAFVDVLLLNSNGLCPCGLGAWTQTCSAQCAVAAFRADRETDGLGALLVGETEKKTSKKKGKEEKFTTMTYLPKPDEQMVYITVQFLWKPRFEIESGCVISVGWYAQDEQKKWKRTASLRGSLSVGCAILTGS